MKRAELVGQKFDRLSVLSFHSISDNKVLWNCLCECGNKTIVRSADLIRGHSRQCRDCSNKMPKPGKRIGGQTRFWNYQYFQYKKRSKDRSITFKLSRQEFIDLCTKNCTYCDSEPNENYTLYNTNVKNYVTENSLSDHTYLKDYIVKFNGIDRKDNEKGYEISNSVTCCSNCNIMKMDMKFKEFLEHIEKIFNHSVKDRHNGKILPIK